MAQNAIYATGSRSGYGKGSVSSSPLPVELLSFKAVKEETRINLNWTTASEINNDYFTIEKSKDAIIFKEVASISGAGNSTALLHYSTIDPNPYTGVSYYRLKQTDYDGKYKYSSAISVNFNENTAQLKIYSDRSKNGIYVQYTGSENTGIQISVLDITGREVAKEELFRASSAQSLYRLAVSNTLGTGTYLVRAIVGNTEQYVQKIIY